jgi:hypothetical protein
MEFFMHYRFVLIVLGVLLTTGVLANRALIEAQTLTANDAAADAYFGQVMAVDGNTLAVASPRANGVGDASGAVYVYTKSGDNWTLQEKVTASDTGADDNFGAALALDGDTLVVGAPIKNSNTGAVYVFTRSGTDWTEQTKITNTDPASDGDLFGSSLALEGMTLVIGSPFQGDGMFPKGAAYVYEGSGASWTRKQKLTLTDGLQAGDFFGASVALDGTRILVGAPFQSTSFLDTFIGAAYIFTLSGDTWTQTGKLTANNGAEEDYFGWSVALEGDTALVGAPQAIGIEGFPNEVDGSGKAYAFTYNGTAWVQEGLAFTQSDAGADERFGWQIILNGSTAYISDDGADEMVNGEARADIGAVYTFTNTGTVWTQADKLSPSQQFVDTEFGGSIAFNGTTLFVGAPGVELDEGAVYVYTDDTVVPTATPTGDATTPDATTTLEPPITPTAEGTAAATASPTSTLAPATVTTAAPTQTPQGAVELLVNGSFEPNLDGWTVKGPAGGKQKCNKLDKVIAHEGECLLQFKSDGVKRGMQQTIGAGDLAAGDTLLLSGYANAKGSVNAKVKVRVSYTDATLAKGKITVKLNAPSGGYQPLTGTLSLTLADTPSQIKVQLQNMGTSGNVRFDALSLVKQAGAGLMALP